MYFQFTQKVILTYWMNDTSQSSTYLTIYLFTWFLFPSFVLACIWVLQLQFDASIYLRLVLLFSHVCFRTSPFFGKMVYVVHQLNNSSFLFEILFVTGCRALTILISAYIILRKRMNTLGFGCTKCIYFIILALWLCAYIICIC